jgi:hypothetical protein
LLTRKHIQLFLMLVLERQKEQMTHAMGRKTERQIEKKTEADLRRRDNRMEVVINKDVGT